MIKLVELDGLVGIRDQLGDQSTEPVVLVNIFHVASNQVEALIDAWTDDAKFFQAQPGFVSTQLHRGTAGSTTFLNYAVWESVAAFGAAFGNPIFQSKLAAYPDGATASPHLFRKLTIDGVSGAPVDGCSPGSAVPASSGAATASGTATCNAS